MCNTDDLRYVVVLRFTEKGAAYEGLMTWTVYKNREEFEKCRPSLEEEVVAEGITPREAIDLSNDNPVEACFNAAVAESVDPATGRVDFARLHRRMRLAMFAIEGSRMKSLLRPSGRPFMPTNETPVEDCLNHAVAESVDPATGRVDLARLKRRMISAILAIAISDGKSNLRLPGQSSEKQ